ncbi:MAG TPA: NADPH:quinone oxidoreductase family protein [Acidimicrobiales bacterium]
MRRVVCSAVGPLEGLSVVEGEPPVPGEGQVQVDVRAAGVNFVDALFVQGLYQIKPPTPFTPGSEVAGEVAAVGPGVEGLAVGDRVLAQCGLGGYAEQVVAHAGAVLPLPASLSYEQGAALVQSYATMLYALTLRTTVAPGETALVLGAGGGIGLAAVDVGRALGLRTIAAASTPEKREAARTAGAEWTLDTTADDVKLRARELAGGGVDVVVDPVGGPLAEPALRALRTGGRYLVIGFASGEIPRLPANQVLLNNRTVVGVDWGAWTLQEPEAGRALLARLLAMADDLRPARPATYPLDRAAEALADLVGRRATGKLVLVP